jgi:hypothetical protein
MPPLTKRQQHSRTNQAKERRKQRKLETWREHLENLLKHEGVLKNNTGHSRTSEEYKIILLVLIFVVKKKVEEKDQTISWTKIDLEVAEACKR